MSKLPIISPQQMGRILKHLGFQLIRQKGSHAFFRHLDGRSTVVPIHKGEDLGRGLIRGILKDIDIEPLEYQQLREEV